MPLDSPSKCGEAQPLQCSQASSAYVLFVNIQEFIHLQLQQWQYRHHGTICHMICSLYKVQIFQCLHTFFTEATIVHFHLRFCIRLRFRSLDKVGFIFQSTCRVVIRCGCSSTCSTSGSLLWLLLAILQKFQPHLDNWPSVLAASCKCVKSTTRCTIAAEVANVG